MTKYTLLESDGQNATKENLWFHLTALLHSPKLKKIVIVIAFALFVFIARKYIESTKPVKMYSYNEKITHEYKYERNYGDEVEERVDWFEDLEQDEIEYYEFDPLPDEKQDPKFVDSVSSFNHSSVDFFNSTLKYNLNLNLDETDLNEKLLTKEDTNSTVTTSNDNKNNIDTTVEVFILGQNDTEPFKGNRNNTSETEFNHRDEVVEGKFSKLREKFGCGDRSQVTKVEQHGDHWVLLNWIPAGHGPIRCHETISFTTHADYSFIHNVRAVAASWQAPISLAVYAPGSDFTLAIEKINQVRHCDPISMQWVSFHLFFHRDHIPENVFNTTTNVSSNYNCSNADIENTVNLTTLYKAERKLTYPVNIARNIARDAALSHLVLAADVELVPNRGLVQDVLQLISEDPPELNWDKPWAFVIPEFEVEETETIPHNKTKLQGLLNDKKAVTFHYYVCPTCHDISMAREWRQQQQTEKMEVLGYGNRTGTFKAWEIINLGPRDTLPSYEERLSWEGKRDKMTQSYLLCVQNYDLLILNNAFVTHTPGIKHYKHDKGRDSEIWKSSTFIDRVLKLEYNSLFGTRDGCVL